MAPGVMQLLFAVGAVGMVVGMLLTLAGLHLIAHAGKSDVDRFFANRPPDKAVYVRPSREPDHTQIDTQPL